MAKAAEALDPTGATCLHDHSDPRHGVRPGWWTIGIAGEYWLFGDDLLCYTRGMLIIHRRGVFETAFPATRQYLENVLADRLERLGWRALWRAPRVGRRQVLRYFGVEERVYEQRAEATA